MKYFILDTNVLLYDPGAIRQFGENQVVIAVEVIEELDAFKRDMTELGQNSRVVSQLLDQLSRHGQLGRGVKMEHGGVLRIYAGDCGDYLRKRGLGLTRKVDNRILNLAIKLQEDEPESEVAIITKNINLRLKADAVGIRAQDYEEIQSTRLKFYTGYHCIDCDKDVVDTFTTTGRYRFEDRTFHANNYLQLRAGNDHDALGRIEGKDGRDLVPLRALDDDVLTIRPLNLAQRFAMDALLDDDIKLVTLLGKAGTGKTLLAVAAGLYKVMIEDKYNKLLVSRPTLPMGRDIGFIPGDIDEKMRPWMQPIYDALEMIRERDRRSKKRMLPPDILDASEVGIEPLTYIRGRSIPHQFFIIDEAQNLTPHEVKTIITRVGYNSKVVLTGDPEQIDNPYLDAHSNGFCYLVDRFRTESISAHITLTKGERSELAAIAANIL